jgi:hypothetical protein
MPHHHRVGRRPPPTRHQHTHHQRQRARRTWKATHAGITLIQTEEPRLLAAQLHKGYTTNPHLAAQGEPEAVDPVTLDQYAQTNNQRHTAIKNGLDQEVFAQQRTLEQRLWELKRIAHERGVNVRAELRIVERGLDALETKIRGQRAA